MEQNQFEGLEEVEKVENTIIATPELKEYEKLLVAERNRQLVEKANNLVNFGCFNQEEVTEIDFTKYSKLSTKKLKGKYDLYQNIDTLDLVYICPLIEDNKDEDGNEKKIVKPYAYDCIKIESMDDETYQMVMKAGKNNLKTTLGFIYKAEYVCFFVLLALALYYIIYTLATSSSTDFFAALASAFYGSAIYIVGATIMLPLMVLTSIKYKKYKNQ